MLATRYPRALLALGTDECDPVHVVGNSSELQGGSSTTEDEDLFRASAEEPACPVQPSPSQNRAQDRPRDIVKAEQDELISSSLNIGIPVLVAWILGYFGFSCLLAGLAAAVAIHNQYR